MIELTEIHMGEEREESAKSFLERLADEDDLATVVNILDNVMSVLVDYAIELGTAEHKKNNDALSMIFFPKQHYRRAEVHRDSRRIKARGLAYVNQN